MSRVLDVLHCPLAGLNLIEASAGTGKTWTIAALYLRLLTEAQADGSPPPSIEQILVVTFTKAATAELRDRLRRRLVELRSAAQAGHSADGLLGALLERHPLGDARRQLLARLEAALAGFDTAAIYTIHGFCQRVLRDAAFASGQHFNVELESDNSALLQQLTDDYWRRELVYDAELAPYLAARGDTPDAWLAEVRHELFRPYLEVPERTRPPLTQRRDAACSLWNKLCSDSALRAASR